MPPDEFDAFYRRFERFRRGDDVPVVSVAVLPQLPQDHLAGGVDAAANLPSRKGIEGIDLV